MTSTNDGKDVKSNQTSGHKTKKYYVDLYNSLDVRLNAPGSIREQTPNVCEAWTKIHSICRHAVSNIHPVLLAWLERHTATVLLQSEWQTDSFKDERESFKTALATLKEEIDYVARVRQSPPQEWEVELMKRAEWFEGVADKPWDHPVLRILLDPQAEPPGDDEVLEWLDGEREVVLTVRLRQLTASKCDDLALSLIGAVLTRIGRQEGDQPGGFESQLKSRAGFTDRTLVLFRDIELVLLYKSDQNPRCIELAKLMPLSSGYEVIQRLLKRQEVAKTSRDKKLWKNVKDVAVLIAQVIVTRCMVSPILEPGIRKALCACAGELARLSSSTALHRAALGLARAARSAHHLYWLARAVHQQQQSDEMKPFICELYVRAITAGVNELENFKTDKKDVEALQFEQVLASWFLELGQLFAANARFRSECMLTAFSMHPSPTMYERIKSAPTLKSLIVETQDSKPESTSEFGSWANDSRTQSNLVKTSETLNLMQTKNNANVLSSAILTEGEALGLSVELCQDISMLLSAPREKTLSWDIEREVLLKNCHTYMERTQCGTRAITTELKFLKVNPNEYKHLPEEDDNEDDIYYGIEKGYEHLVEIEEPQLETMFPYDVTTESDVEFEHKPIKPKPRRKKVKKITSDSDDDPLSTVPEKREAKKERAHSKERNTEKPKERKESKERKKKVKPEKDGTEKKEKKVRKKKEKPAQNNDASGSLSSLVAIKVNNGQSITDEVSSHTEIPSHKNELESKKHRTQHKLSGQKTSTARYPLQPGTSKSSVAKLLMFRRQKLGAAQSSTSQSIPPKPVSNLVGAKISQHDNPPKFPWDSTQTEQMNLWNNEINKMLGNQTGMKKNVSNYNTQNTSEVLNVQKPVNSSSKPNHSPKPRVTYNFPTSSGFDSDQKCFQEFLKQHTNVFIPPPIKSSNKVSKSNGETKVKSSPSAKTVKAVGQKKVDNAPNTFSRLSYMHKNKQESKPKQETVVNTPQSSSATSQMLNLLDDKIQEQRLAKSNVCANVMKYLQKKGVVTSIPVTQKVEVQTIQSLPKLTPIEQNNPIITNLLQSPAAMFANQTSQLQTDLQSAQSSSFNQTISPKPIVDADQQELLYLLQQQSKLNNKQHQPKLYTAKIDHIPVSNTIVKNNNVLQKAPSNTIILNNQIPTISKSTIQGIKIMKSSDIVKNNLSLGNQNKSDCRFSGSVLELTPQRVTQYANETVIKTPVLENTMDQTKVKSNKQSDVVKNNESSGYQNKSDCRFGGPAKEQTPQIIKQYTNYKTSENKDDITKILDAIRAQKTPSRGPKALDMALERDSFDRYTQQSQADNLRNQRIMRPNQPLINAPSVIKSTHNVKEELSNMMPTSGTEIKNKPNQPLIQKQTCVKNVKSSSVSQVNADPFISGLPNSDYDLIGELMDDDLRRELGELSSDEETNGPKQSKTTASKPVNATKKKPATPLPIKNKPIKVDPRNIVIAKNVNDGNTKINNTSVIKGSGASSSRTNTKLQILSNEVVNFEKLKKLTKPRKEAKNVTKSVKAQIRSNVTKQMQNQSKTSTSQHVLTPVEQPEVKAINKCPATSQIQHQSNKSIPQQALTNQKQVQETNVSGFIQQHNNFSAPQSAFVQQPAVVMVASNAYDPYCTLQVPAPQNTYVINNYSNLSYQPAQFAQNISPILINTPIVQAAIPFQVQTIPVIEHPNIIQTNATLMCSNHTMTASDPIEELIRKKCSEKDETRSKVVDDFNPELLLRNGFVDNEEKGDISPKNETKLDLISNKTSERKGLSEVQEKLKALRPEKIDPKGQILSSEDNVEKDNFEQERLKIKRLSIVNRKLNHVCDKPPIPLSYEPLLISATKQESKITLTGPQNDKSKSGTKPNISTAKSLSAEKSIVTEEIKNPVTPESVGDVENKPANVINTSSCRRILLRSNKVKTSPIANKNIGRKTKVRLKSAVDVLLKTENESSRPSLTNEDESVNKEIIEKNVPKNVDNVRTETNSSTRISTRIKEKKTKKAIRKIKNIVTPLDSKPVTEKQESELIQTSEASIQTEGSGKETPKRIQPLKISKNGHTHILKTSEIPDAVPETPLLSIPTVAPAENLPKNSGANKVNKETEEDDSILTILKDMGIIRIPKNIPKFTKPGRTNKLKQKNKESLHKFNSNEKHNIPKNTNLNEVAKRNVLVQNNKNTNKEIENKLVDPLLVSRAETCNGSLVTPNKTVDKLTDSKVTTDSVIAKEVITLASDPETTNNVTGENDSKLSKINTLPIKTNDVPSKTSNVPSKTNNVPPKTDTLPSKINTPLVTNTAPSKIVPLKTNTVPTKTNTDPSKTELPKKNAPHSVLSAEEELQKFKESITIESLPVDKTNPGRRQVRITLASGKVFKAAIFGDVPVDINSLFLNESVKQVLQGEFNGSKRCTLNVRQYTSINDKKVIDTRVTEVNVAKTVPTAVETNKTNFEAVETVNLVSDDEDECDKMLTFATEKGKYNVSPLETDIFEKHQSKFSQICTVKLNKWTPPKEVSPKKEEVINDLIKNLHEDLIPTPVVECIDVDSLEDSDKEPENIDELKDKLLKDLGVASILEPPVITVESDTEDILPEVTSSEVISLDEGSESDSVEPIDYSEIIKRKCIVKLVNCDDNVARMKIDHSHITDTSEDEMDEPELKRAGSFSILNDLDVDDLVIAGCDSNRSSPVINISETIESMSYSDINEHTYGRNSPVMEAFDLMTNLQKPNTRIDYPEMTSFVCHSEWFETKRNINDLKEFDPIVIESEDIEVMDISTDCESFLDINHEISVCKSEWLKETKQKIIADFKTRQHEIADLPMEAVASVHYLDESAPCVSEYLCTKKQIANIAKDTIESMEPQDYEIVFDVQYTDSAEPTACYANWFECKSFLHDLALKQTPLCTVQEHQNDCKISERPYSPKEETMESVSIPSLIQIVTKYLQHNDITNILKPLKVKLKYRRIPTASLKRKFQPISTNECQNVSTLLHPDIKGKRTKLCDEHSDVDPAIAIEERSPFIPNEEIETLPVYDLVEQPVSVLKACKKVTKIYTEDDKLLEKNEEKNKTEVFVNTPEETINTDSDVIVTNLKESSEVELTTTIVENLSEIAETRHEDDNQEIDKQNQIVSVYEDINVEVNTSIDVSEIPEPLIEDVNENSNPSNDTSLIWDEEESTHSDIATIDINNEAISLIIPKVTYSRNSGKRKADMSDIKINAKRYRKGKNIDSPKISVTQIMISAYSKEYKKLLDYYTLLGFSFSVSYDKEYIDVPEIIQNWPIQGPYMPVDENTADNKDDLLFVEEKEERCLDPLQQTLTEEINAEYVDDYPIVDSEETNFNMGFGEGSGRVIQNLEEDGAQFSAATLSDVKHSQPFLLSEHYENIGPCLSESKTQTENIRRHVSFMQLREKVRSFFEKSTAEINDVWDQDKIKSDQNKSSFPFDYYIGNDMRPHSIVTQVQVVQVGQLPVSTAAQNPVTCDPRVTQVSDASPQCSVESSPQDDLQSGIKTEYTELTTADLSSLQGYAQHNQTMPVDNQLTEVSGANDNIPIETELIKSEVKIELIEENPEEREVMKRFDDSEFETDLNNIAEKHVNNIDYDFDANNGSGSSEFDNNTSEMFNSVAKSNESEVFSPPSQQNGTGNEQKTDQLAHAMNAAGITASPENVPSPRSHPLVNILTQKLTSTVNSNQNSTVTYSKATSINAMSLHQALASILPPPLNQTSLENNQSQNHQVTPQVLHIVQGKNASGNQITLVDNSQQSVINNPNATPVLHIVQNKSNAGSTNGTPNPQQTFSGLSLVDTGLQQGGNQLLQIVNTGNQKNANAGQLLKRVNLLTNLTNVQGSNEQKMVQFVCKSADGKSIHLNAPHQRSMVLRLQPIETPTVQNTQQKPAENPDLNQSTGSANSNNKDQEIKSRSMYEDNYAKFIQNSSSKTPTSTNEKSTSLPKFNQAFGKTVYQDGGQKQNDMNNSNATTAANNENNECPATENMNLELGQISNPPLLLRKSPAQTSQAQTNLVQQIKQTIAPMNIQTMHGGVIYTRQIPVNIGGGQTINLITVPTTELVDESGQKQQTEVKFVNQGDIEPSIIKIVPQTQTSQNTESSDENNLNTNNDNSNAQTPQPQPMLTQMRIKLPMLSKTPQMMAGARVVRPSFFQIQRNVIGGANQPVYQQLVLTAAPPLGQQIRLQNPQAQVTRPIKVPSESQSSTESMSSSTLEQLREFDMVLEQVKERSTVQPNSNSTNTFKLHTATTDTTDSAASSTSTETTQQVLYSIGSSQAVNVAYVNRKATVTTPTLTTFQRSPDSSGIVDSPSSSSQVQLSHTSHTSEASSSESHSTAGHHKPKHKPKTRPKASSNPPMKINPVPPKPTTQKPLEDEQTTQRILYILAEYKEQVENSPDKDKPAPRRRSNPPSNPGSSKRKKSSSGSRRGRDSSPVHGDDTRTMGSEDSSCGTSQGDCTENCLESTSPQESPRKVARKLTFEQEVPPATPRSQPPRNVIVADGQTITVTRGTPGKPATAVLMPANYILPVSMVKGGQQIAIVTNRGPKLLTVGGGEGGTTNALLLQRLIGPAGLKPVLTRPGVRHVRLPTAALQNLQTFNLATTASTVNPPDSTASPAPAPTADLADSQAGCSPWAEREADNIRPERSSSPEGSEPWNLPSSADAQDYSYEETVRADNLDRTVLDQIPDRYSPDMEAQRIFDKMFDVDSKKSYIDSPRCGFDIDASDDDKAYHQVVQKKDLSSARQHRLAHVSAAALRHKYAILEHELRLQKSLSEECSDLGVDSPSAMELFPEAELLFAQSPQHDTSLPHNMQPLLNQTVIQPDIDDQIATDQLLTNDLSERQDLDVNLGLEDVGIVTVSEDGMQATIALDQEEFARAHPNTTFHSEPTDDGEMQQPFTITGLKNRHITSTIFHSNRAPATVLMTPQSTVISQTDNQVKYDIDNMINLPSSHNLNLSSVLVKDDGLTRLDNILTDSRELHLSNTASAIVHSQGNATQVIRRVCYDNDKRETEYILDEPDAIIAGDDAKMIAEDNSSRDATLESMADDDNSSPEQNAELFWESNSASERSESRRPLDFSSDSEKCCKSPSYDETNSTDSSGVGTHMRLDSVIKEARVIGRSGSGDGSSTDDVHPPLRTYPPKRSYHQPEEERSLSGKTRAGERSPDSLEVRRRASNRGVVKRGCHCCNGSPAPQRSKKPRQRKPTMDFTQ